MPQVSPSRLEEDSPARLPPLTLGSRCASTGGASNDGADLEPAVLGLTVAGLVAIVRWNVVRFFMEPLDCPAHCPLMMNPGGGSRFSLPLSRKMPSASTSFS